MSLLPHPHSHPIQPHSKLFSHLHHGTFYYQGHWTVPSSPLNEFATQLQAQPHLLLFSLSEDGALVINIVREKKIVRWLQKNLWAGCIFRFVSSSSSHSPSSNFNEPPLFSQSSRATNSDPSSQFNHDTHVCYLTLRDDTLPLSDLNILNKSVNKLSFKSPKPVEVRSASPSSKKGRGTGIQYLSESDPIGIIVRQMVEKRIWELEKPSAVDDLVFEEIEVEE